MAIGGALLMAMTLSLAFALVYPTPFERLLATPEFPPHWFEGQLVDHFDPTNRATFAQQYFVNNQSYRPGGPIILYINGEGPISAPPYLPDDEAVMLAEEHHALIVTIEHRYYGLSVPVADLSYDNMRFLTVEQALADLAYFTLWFNETQVGSSRWFNIGGSYSGALSAWYRLKYPQLTCCAVASSGVVHAISEFPQFDQQVALAAGPSCAQRMREVNELVTAAVLGNSSTNAAIKKLWNATMLENDGDFLFYVNDKMAESVQYGFVKDVCAALFPHDPADLLPSIANYTNSFAAPILGGPLGYAYATSQQTAIDPNLSANRAWWWQKCTQLGFWQIAPSENSIRSPLINMTWHQWRCQVVFGDQYQWPPTINVTNADYGGNHTASSMIWFNQGSADPWKAAGVRQWLSLTEPAWETQCDNCGHCVDIRGCPSAATDRAPAAAAAWPSNGCASPGALDATREVIFAAVRDWLSIC